MLANVLKSELAMKMSIHIIQIFIKLRETLLTHKDILLKPENFEKTTMKQEEEIKLIFKYLKELLNPKTESCEGLGSSKKVWDRISITSPQVRDGGLRKRILFIIKSYKS